MKQSEEIPFDVRSDIALIRQDVKRVLDHHVEFKQMLAGFQKAIHEEEVERKEEDSFIRAECKEGVSQIYKNVAGYGVTLVVFLTTAILGFLVYRT